MVAQQTPDWQSVLKTAAKGGEKYPPLLVIWGPPGLGKTTFAVKRTESPCVLAFEVGARSVQRDGGYDVFPPEASDHLTIQSWPEALLYVRALAYGVHPHKTVVIDSLNPMEALCIAYVVSQSKHGSYEKMGWGKEAVVTGELRVMLSLLERVKRRGIQVIITAHDKRKNVKNDPILGDYTRFNASTQIEATWSAIHEWADIVGYCRDDFGAVEGRAVKVSDLRTLHTVKGAAYDAKQRAGYEMRSPVALDWLSFKEALEQGGDTAETIVSRITALALDIGDPDVAAKTKTFVDTCKGDVGKLLELENALKLQKEKMK